MRAYVALGSNLGDRLGNLSEALRRVDETEHAEVHAVSRAYESEPWGVTDQPAFANAVAIVETSMRADDLLQVTREIERDMGRVTGERNEPRVIDLDILLFGDEEWDTPDLVIPHPRMLERDFVVTPLLDVDPEACMPDGSPVAAAVATLGRVTGSLGAIPGFEDRMTGRAVSNLHGDTGPDAPASGVPLAEDAPRVPWRRPLPDEEWVSVWERTVGRATLMSMPRSPLSGGLTPDADAAFAALVLDQIGVPHAWDPFEPGLGSDPIGFVRPFKLLVPASMAEEALDALNEAANAPIDWSDLDPPS